MRDPLGDSSISSVSSASRIVVEALLVNDFGGDTEVLGALHGLTEIAVFASDHVERRHVDDHIASDGHGPQLLAEHGRVGPQLHSPLAAAEDDDAPAAGVAHRGEIGDQAGESGVVTDRVAADHREPQPRAIGDGRGAIGGEVITLRRLHRERRKRVARGRVHQREYPRQIGRVRTCRCRPHEYDRGRHHQQIAEQIERKEHRGEPGDEHHQRRGRVPRGDRPAEEDATGDQHDCGQYGQ